MYTDHLPVTSYLRHLRRQSIPEILDTECLAALDNVEAQYGETLSFGAGLEVRLGSPQRYADFILCVRDESLFQDARIWIEMDYQSFRRPGKISPCLFLNTWDSSRAEDPGAYWEHILTVFVGKGRAEKLRNVFHDLTGKLPRTVRIKQIGSMARPGEADCLRVVLYFREAKQIPETMAGIGWKGDTSALGMSLEPWDDANSLSVNIDLDSTGIREKTGIEISPVWRHPVLVDRMISRLEDAGLCRKDKGQALRRWIRIPHDTDPYIQTLISHYKLNYADGKITEAKAYLEQSPFPLHRFT